MRHSVKFGVGLCHRNVMSEAKVEECEDGCMAHVEGVSDYFPVKIHKNHEFFHFSEKRESPECCDILIKWTSSFWPKAPVTRDIDSGSHLYLLC